MPVMRQVWAKNCTQCGQMYVVDEPTREMAIESMRAHFHRDFDKNDFLQVYCKKCNTERGKKAPKVFT